MNYCSAPKGCVCPPGTMTDAKFTPIAAGREYVTVTGGTSPATVTVDGLSVKAFCTPACIFGTWHVTDLSSPTINGAAGITWTNNPDGTILVDYDGSAPVVGPAGEFTWSGSARYTTTLPPHPEGSTGSYVATPVVEGVTATYITPAYLAALGPRPVTDEIHTTTWTCNGNSLKLDIVVDGYPVVYTLARAGR